MQKQIDITKLVFELEIGQGAFGTVYKGKYGDIPVAIKVIQEYKFTPTGHRVNMDRRWKWFLDEEYLLNMLCDDTIVEYIGSYIPEGCRDEGWDTVKMSYPLPCLVFGLCEGGSLYTCIRRVRKRMENYLKSLNQNPNMFDGPVLPKNDVIDSSIRLFQGIAHLHDKGYVHRDVKSDNVLVNINGEIKLTDFGMAIPIQTIKPGLTGSLRWMAPEVRLGKLYDEKVDIYSAGIVMWELVAGQIPFWYVSAESAAKTAAAGHRPMIPFHCDKDFALIIEACWDEEPKLRPAASTVVRWLQELKSTGKVNFSNEETESEVNTSMVSSTVPSTVSSTVPMECDTHSTDSEVQTNVNLEHNTTKFIHKVGKLFRQSLEKKRTQSVSN